MSFINGFEKSAGISRKSRSIDKGLLYAGSAALGVGASKLYRHLKAHKKEAAGPNLDPKKVSEFSKGFNSGGPGLAESWGNVKKGLGFGGSAPKTPTPPPAPGNVGKMNG